MIIPTFKKEIPYFYDLDTKGIAHSYQNSPPGYSEAQTLFTFKYEGLLDEFNFIGQEQKDYVWTVNPPFFIVEGQGTNTIKCEQIPLLTKEREQIIYVNKTPIYRDLKYSDLNLKISRWEESINLYYRQGPLWKIDGNTNPKINTIETYTIIPLYNQKGSPPKNITNNNSYSFNIKNGKVVKFYGDTPPHGNPIVDILWYDKGTSYISFYSAWQNETLKFPNTLNVYVSD
jgi:hypothetical protein